MARREYQDPSILTRSTPHGDEYYLRYRVKVVEIEDGKPVVKRREKWLALGLCRETTMRQAERKKAEVMREVNGQVYTLQSHVPFPEFCRIYRDTHLPTLRVPTQRTYDQWLRKYIEPHFAPKKLYEIRPADLQAFLMALPVADLTRNSIRGVLSSLWACATRWGYWKETSPVSLVRLGTPVAKYSQASFTPDEIRKILAAVDDDMRLIIETLIWTGMRISECLGLRWEQVDLVSGMAYVTQRQCRGDVSSPKTKRSKRALPLGYLADSYRSLKVPRAPRPEDYVFLRPDGEPYIDCELLANHLTPILVSLGIKRPGMGWHAFRRTHLTWFSEGGATAFETQDQAGHASIETTRLYVQQNLARREAVIKSMQERFGLGEDKGTIQ